MVKHVVRIDDGTSAVAIDLRGGTSDQGVSPADLAMPLRRWGRRAGLDTFDAKSLLTAPPMDVNALAEKLARIKALGMGGAPIELPDGSPIFDVDLVAHGEKPAHFVVRGKK